MRPIRASGGTVGDGSLVQLETKPGPSAEMIFGDWYPAVRDQMIARQGATGSWSGEYSDDYCTAMALIVLQMPNRYLPVFNGKGPGD